MMVPIAPLRWYRFDRYVGTDWPILSKDKPEEIDEICNRDEVYNLAEKCANTGFGILKEWIEQLDEETFFYKLIGYMDKQFEVIESEVETLVKWCTR